MRLFSCDSSWSSGLVMLSVLAVAVSAAVGSGDPEAGKQTFVMFLGVIAAIYASRFFRRQH